MVATRLLYMVYMAMYISISAPSPRPCRNAGGQLWETHALPEKQCMMKVKGLFPKYTGGGHCEVGIYMEMPSIAPRMQVDEKEG